MRKNKPKKLKQAKFSINKKVTINLANPHYAAEHVNLQPIKVKLIKIRTIKMGHTKLNKSN